MHGPISLKIVVVVATLFKFNYNYEQFNHFMNWLIVKCTINNSVMKNFMILCIVFCHMVDYKIEFPYST